MDLYVIGIKGRDFLSSILDFRLTAQARSDLLDECVFVDGLGDVAGAAGG
jgi:hypothetical protein